MVHPAYRAGVERAGRDLRFEGPLPVAPEGATAVEAREGKAGLAACVDQAGKVLAARHSGARGPERAVLDGLCGLLVGRPLQEGADHAVLRLESALRDRSLPPPVPGVLTPANADPVFARPQRLVRSLFAAWLGRTGRAAGANEWNDGPSPSWLALALPERAARARKALLDGCRELGLPRSGVEVLAVVKETRLVLALTPATAKLDFAAGMMKLESLARRALRARVELCLESVEDRNKRRRTRS